MSLLDVRVQSKVRRATTLPPACAPQRSNAARGPHPRSCQKRRTLIGRILGRAPDAPSLFDMSGGRRSEAKSTPLPSLLLQPLSARPTGHVCPQMGDKKVLAALTGMLSHHREYPIVALQFILHQELHPAQTTPPTKWAAAPSLEGCGLPSTARLGQTRCTCRCWARASRQAVHTPRRCSLCCSRLSPITLSRSRAPPTLGPQDRLALRGSDPRATVRILVRRAAETPHFVLPAFWRGMLTIRTTDKFAKMPASGAGSHPSGHGRRSADGFHRPRCAKPFW